MNIKTLQMNYENTSNEIKIKIILKTRDQQFLFHFIQVIISKLYNNHDYLHQCMFKLDACILRKSNKNNAQTKFLEKLIEHGLEID